MNTCKSCGAMALAGASKCRICGGPTGYDPVLSDPRVVALVAAAKDVLFAEEPHERARTERSLRAAIELFKT